MCANYTPPPPRYLRDRYGLEVTFDYKPEAYPTYDAPILQAGLEPVRATFGIVPHWAISIRYATKTYNARCETVATLPSFRNAWKKRQFCLIPAADFFEPNWETGKAIRYRIRRCDGEPFALAGIWETRRVDDQLHRSFSMLTVNATDHPLMKHFHRPEEEKRSVVVLDAADYERWLAVEHEEEARSMLTLFDPAQFTAEPAPRPPRPTMSESIVSDPP